MEGGGKKGDIREGDRGRGERQETVNRGEKGKLD